MQPEERFAELVQEFAGRDGVTVPEGSGPRRFGSSALRVNGSIFAMLQGGRLVVKLPAPRVAELIESGTGRPFDAGKGRPMKEWVALDGLDAALWRRLADEAYGFVGSGKRVSRRRGG